MRRIEARTRDLGDGFVVGRILPSPGFRTVGPFIFFDHMGPAQFAPGEGFDVRPHPHIGLATVTYLFAGEMLHRDSLGFVQAIEPGAVNWMTAGRGIVHSERTSDAKRSSGQAMHGIQAWVALPATHEETEPSFVHHPAATLPTISFDGARRTLIAGSAFHATSPVAVASPLFYIDVEAEAGARVQMPDDHAERALYVAVGAVEIAGEVVPERTMAVLEPGRSLAFTTTGPARVMLLGGAPLESPRTIWWNFVSSRPERIEQAKADWAAGRFAMVPGDPEFIPLPQ